MYPPQGLGDGRLIAGVSTGGNTLGTTGTVNRQMVFVGGNNVTLSQSINAQSGTITISVGSAGAFSGGASTLGNTAGSTGIVSNQIVFVGGNNITLSQSTGGVSSATITVSGPNMLSAGISTLGNTAGSTGLVSNQIVFVGGNNITLSQSTGGASSATITISAIASSSLVAAGNVSLSTAGSTITISGIQPVARAFALSMDTDQAWAQSNGDLRLFPFAMPFYMTATKAHVVMNISNSSSAEGTVLLNIALYTYTISTANTLSSTFRSFSYNSTMAGSSYTDISGTRYRSISLASWAFTPGDYLLVIQNSVTTALTSGTYQFMGKSGLSINAEEFVGGNVLDWGMEGNGSFGSSVIPASLHISDINRTGSVARRHIYCMFHGI